MPAKKKRPARSRSRRRPATPPGPTIDERLEKLETTTARLVEIAERHGDEVFPKPRPPAEDTPAPTP